MILRLDLFFCCDGRRPAPLLCGLMCGFWWWFVSLTSPSFSGICQIYLHFSHVEVRKPELWVENYKGPHLYEPRGEKYIVRHCNLFLQHLAVLTCCTTVQKFKKRCGFVYKHNLMPSAENLKFGANLFPNQNHFKTAIFVPLNGC